MTKQRKPLNEILEKFENLADLSSHSSATAPSVNLNDSSHADSLTAQLANPKKKSPKIRFTLDLEKPLDDRLTKAAKQLNRSKADLTRVALIRLLDQLDTEWYTSKIK